MAFENTICRACLTEIEVVYPLFNVYENNLSLASILNKFITTKINENDGLPSVLCKECIEIVIKFYNFLEAYEVSRKTLHDILNEQDNDEYLQSDTDLSTSFMDNDTLDSIETATTVSDINKEYEYIQIIKMDDNPKLPVIEQENEVINYKCEICGQIFLYFNAFKRHKMKHLVKKGKYNKEIGKRFKCNKCDQYFRTRPLLILHQRNHKGYKREILSFICDICGKACTTKHLLKDHLETHSSSSNYTCHICNKKLRCRTSLSRHIKLHTQPMGNMCELCGRRFTQISSLRTHHNLVHVKPTKKFQCVICNKLFTMKATMQKHLERHSKKEVDDCKFHCTQCNMKYYDKSSLNRHIDYKHGNKTLLKCDICEREFYSRTNLMKHRLNKHTELVAVEGIDYEIIKSHQIGDTFVSNDNT